MVEPPQSALARVVLALYGAHPRAQPPGRTHLQKEMFFLARRHPQLASDCAFENYLEGPWSDVVRETSRTLESDGLLIRAGGHASQISDAGEQALMSLRTDRNNKSGRRAALWEDIEQVVDFCHQITADELLLITYVDAPETRSQSIRQSAVLAQRQQLARAMYERGVVSLARAAELAGLHVRDVQGW